MDIKKCYCKGGEEGQTCLFYPLLHVVAPSEHGLMAHQHSEFSNSPPCQGLIHCQIMPQVPANKSWCKTLPVLAGQFLLMPSRICKHKACALVPGHGLQSGPEEWGQAHILLLTGLFKVGFIFFTVDACEIQCHTICICFSEVFLMYTAWPLGQGNVSETCMMGCDSAGVFLGKFWEIYLIPALVWPNLLIVKVTIATNPSKSLETGLWT